MISNIKATPVKTYPSQIGNVNNNVSFGKNYAEIIDDVLHLPQMYEKLSKTKPMQKIATSLSKGNGFTHLLVADSAMISSTYMVSTLKNKKIDKDQKPAMIVNDALVWTFSTACTYLLDKKLNNVMEDVITKFVDVNRSNSKIMQHLDDYVSGIKKIKSVVVAGMIYRFCGPVIMTPIANKISKKIQGAKNSKDGSVPTESPKTLDKKA